MSDDERAKIREEKLDRIMTAISTQKGRVQLWESQWTMQRVVYPKNISSKILTEDDLHWGKVLILGDLEEVADGSRV